MSSKQVLVSLEMRVFLLNHWHVDCFGDPITQFLTGVFSNQCDWFPLFATRKLAITYCKLTSEPVQCQNLTESGHRAAKLKGPGLNSVCPALRLGRPGPHFTPVHIHKGILHVHLPVDWMAQ